MLSEENGIVMPEVGKRYQTRQITIFGTPVDAQHFNEVLDILWVHQGEVVARDAKGHHVVLTQEPNTLFWRNREQDIVIGFVPIAEPANLLPNVLYRRAFGEGTAWQFYAYCASPEEASDLAWTMEEHYDYRFGYLGQDGRLQTAP